MSNVRDITQQPGCACGGPSDCGSSDRRPLAAAPPAGGARGHRRRRARPPHAGREFELCGTLVLDGQRLPMGVCWVRQSAREAALTWRTADGAARAREIDLPMLRQLLEEGVLRQAARAGAKG